MKNVKYLIIFALLVVSAGLFSANATIAFKDATTATYNYVLQEDPAYPVSTPTAYKWVVKAYLSSDNVVDPLLTTGEPSVNDVFLVDLRLGFNSSGFLSISSAVVPEATWMGADTWIYLRVFNNATFSNATKYMTFFAPYKIIAGGLTNVNIIPTYGWDTDPAVWNWIAPPPADTWTYNLTVNGPVGYTVTGPGTYTGAMGTTFTCGPNNTDINDLVGLWTPSAAPANFHWEPATVTVAAADFTGAKVAHVYNATKTFALVADPDTYSYTLNVTGDAGYSVTGPTGTMPFPAIFVDPNNDITNELLGTYTPSAAAPGFHWVPASFEVTADMFTTGKGSALGSRTNGSKVLIAKVANISFVLTANPTTTYTLTVNGPAAYQVTGPDGTPHNMPYVYTDSNDMINNLTGPYAVPAAPEGWFWTMNPINVSETDFTANAATITFVLNETPVIYTPAADETGFPSGYPTTNYVNVAVVVTGVGWHNIFVARQATDTGAMAYYNGQWNAPDGSPDWTWLNVNLSAKAPVQVIVFGPTLPVELSSFSAILTAQNFVKLTWVTESETNMNGYNVYRNETADYAAATHIGYQASTNSSTQHVYSHTDNEVETNNTYYYWLECVDFNGTSTLYGPQYVTVVGNDVPNLPNATALKNAYPNPFKTSTTIAVDVKEGENATVTIYNILGQAVMTYRVPAGSHNLNWNGRDSKGNNCGSGIYFYKLSSPTMNQTKKMVIVK